MDRIGPGTKIAERYILCEIIGTGGFGETWRAHDELLDMDVAVKVYLDSDPKQRERYLREARSLAKYSHHPGIAAVRDFLAEDGCLCLIMEYVAGVDLTNVISANGKLDLQATLTALSPVADALTSLHEANLLHRDVSPDNIRLHPDGTGVLLDFGSVLAVEDTMRRTITVKPGYAPPEQYGEASSLGPWTDVYALAATVYHALTGSAPTDSLRRTFSDDLVRPSQLGIDMPDEAEDALMRALELDYRNRTKSVQEFMEGLSATGPAADADKQNVPPTSPEPQARDQHPDQRPEQDSGQDLEQYLKQYLDQNAEPAHPATERPPANGSDAKKPDKRAVDTTAKRSHGSHGAKKFLPIIIGVIIVALLGVGIVLLRGRGGRLGDYKSRYNDGIAEGSISVKDETFTDEMVDEILADKSADMYVFRNCVISDAQLERLSKKENLNLVRLVSCSGFTTLAPFADAQDFSMLYLEEEEDLDFDALFPAEMPNVTHLIIRQSSIANQGEGLTRFPNVKALELSDTTGVQNIDFLANMQKVYQVNLRGVDLSNDKDSKLAEYVQNAPYLSTIYLDNTGITSVEWVAKCPKITRAGLSGNHISDASPLASATSLENLSIANNQLTNLDFCESLINLETLDASHNKISSTSKLATCALLKELYLQDNQITGLEALQNGFSNLEVLNVSTNKLTSLKDLADCAALQAVVANNNEIASLEGLANKPELAALLLDGNKIADISDLASSAKHLLCLDLGHNQVSDVSALSEFGTDSKRSSLLDGLDVKGLLLDHNQIARIDGLPQARYDLMTLHGNPLADPSPLAGSEWEKLYLPYAEGADYGFVGEVMSKHALAGTCLVDVPYDKQVKVLRDTGLESKGSSSQPKFLTEAEADAELQDLRNKVNEKVSGNSNEDSSDSEEA